MADPASLAIVFSTAAGYLGASAATAATIGSVVSTAASIAYVGFTAYTVYNALTSGGGTQRYEGPRLGDLSVQSSARGAVLPRVWGAARISGNVIHGRRTEVVEVDRQRVGGKGGSGTTVENTTYTYFGDFAVTLCEGPIVGIRRIWLNNKLFWDNREGLTAEAMELSAENAQYFKLYTGTATQAPDPTLESIEGVGNVPPYQHTAYLVFTQLPLLNYGNALPQVSVEVVAHGDQGELDPPVRFNPDVGTLLYTDGAVQDPVTRRVWINTFDEGFIRVFEPDLLTWTDLPHPNLATFFNHPSARPVYVPSTGEMWVVYDSPNSVATAYLWTSIAVYNAATLELVTDFTINWPSEGPLAYNPIRDEVIAFDGTWGGGGHVFHAKNYWQVGNIDPAPSLVFKTVNLDHYAQMVMIGFGRWFYVLDLNLNISKARFDVAEFSTIKKFISHDPLRDVVWFVSQDSANVYQYDPASVTLNLAGTLPVEQYPGFDDIHGMVYVPAVDRLVIRTLYPDYSIHLVHPVTFTVESTIKLKPDAQDTTRFNAGIWGDLTYLPGTNYVILRDRVKIHIASSLSSGVPLSVIVRDLCIDAGLVDADIDVSELTDFVMGYTRPQPMPVTSALEPLMVTYLFDAVESDGILKFRKRGLAPVATIAEADLAAQAGDNPQAIDPLPISRTQEVELPGSVTVRYVAQEFDYQQGSQHLKRVFTQSKNSIQFDLPIVLVDDYAKQLAEILINNSWIERKRYRLALSVEHLRLDPADVIRVTYQGFVYTVRLTRVEYGPPGLMLCDAVEEEASVYSSDLQATELLFTSPVLLAPTAITAYLLDIPTLRDEDDGPGFYAAMVPDDTDGWRGGVLYESQDDGVSYSAIFTFSKPAVAGHATTLLPAGPTGVWDRLNTVTVSVREGGVLFSAYEHELINSGVNAIALKSGSGWEILQFATATLNQGGTYTLSNLLRGRKGSEWAVGGHAIGDTFVYLTPTTVGRIGQSLTDLNAPRRYKAVPVGTRVDRTVRYYEFTNTGVSLKPYSPAYLQTNKNNTQDIIVSWIRRSRLGKTFMNGVDPPLAEEAESYDLEILNSSATSVIRTYSQLSARQVRYSVAEQVNDFGAQQDNLCVRVFQRSATVGRGYPTVICQTDIQALPPPVGYTDSWGSDRYPVNPEIILLPAVDFVQFYSGNYYGVEHAPVDLIVSMTSNGALKGKKELPPLDIVNRTEKLNILVNKPVLLDHSIYFIAATQRGDAVCKWNRGELDSNNTNNVWTHHLYLRNELTSPHYFSNRLVRSGNYLYTYAYWTGTGPWVGTKVVNYALVEIDPGLETDPLTIVQMYPQESAGGGTLYPDATGCWRIRALDVVWETSTIVVERLDLSTNTVLNQWEIAYPSGENRVKFTENRLFIFGTTSLTVYDTSDFTLVSQQSTVGMPWYEASVHVNSFNFTPEIWDTGQYIIVGASRSYTEEDILAETLNCFNPTNDPIGMHDFRLLVLDRLNGSLKRIIVPRHGGYFDDVLNQYIDGSGRVSPRLICGGNGNKVAVHWSSILGPVPDYAFLKATNTLIYDLTSQLADIT